MSDDYNPILGDLEAKALSRLIWQYQNGAKMKAWLTTLPGIAEERLNQAARDIAALVNVDEAEGEALNICGRIAQIERPVIPEPQLADVTYLTALADDPPSMADDGSQLMSLDYAIPLEAQDYLYRRLIKSKIAINNSDVTIDEFSRALAFAAGLEPESVKVIDYQDMTFSVVFGVMLDEITRYVFSNYPFVPRPQGVKLLGYVEQPLFMQMNDEGNFSMGDELAQLGNLEEVFA